MALSHRAGPVSDAQPDARESARLVALARYEILDTPPEAVFERIARLIKIVFDTPIAIVSLIDGHRQWYKAGIGLAANEVSLPDTFCRHLLHDSQALVIPDAQLDQRVANNPLVVGEPHIRFYAGAPLITGDGHTIGTVCAVDTKPRSFTPREQEVLAELAGMAMDAMELRRQASVDFLTNSLSRRAFLEAARPLFALAIRHQEPLSCLALDLDHFKSVNDSHGHAVGDAALKAVAEACRQSLGDSDLFARLGGEEFVVLLPRTDAKTAHRKAERLRATVAALAIPSGRRTIRVTASLGIAELEPGIDDLEGLIERSDAALYRAKSAGRNQCATWTQLREPVAVPLRRRVLKAGRISFGNNSFTVDCTVRTLGMDGAGIDVSSTLDLPDRFDLTIPADGFSRVCKIVMRGDKHIEVGFV